MDERVHILNILKKVQVALEKKDYVKIKRLSDKIIDHVSVHQDVDLLSVAVIIYALSKLIERDSYKDEKNWESFYASYRGNIKKMIVSLENRDEKGFREDVDASRKLIHNLGGKLKRYIGDVIQRAKMNKASRLYDKGISMEKTAKALGVSLWELSEYMGPRVQSKENIYITMPVRERVKIVRGIFG
ncbi:hypothetical protein CMI38_01610 [Candidatus Pacearchaeota archaeon]|jgi:hypothetical protein|nr:hypothetical protein [Candidatus Pacearchaeota archaeon]|tara:strand:- start:1988 stop:2548 length:561 start_codon:yes stop_codon:yes gene_type:complete